MNEQIKKRYNRISGIYELMDRMIKKNGEQTITNRQGFAIQCREICLFNPHI